MNIKYLLLLFDEMHLKVLLFNNDFEVLLFVSPLSATIYR